MRAGWLWSFFRVLAIGAVAAAIVVAALIPFIIWGTEKAPEFYDAFTAAIVAAIAVVLGTLYQSELTRKRDETMRLQALKADFLDLYFWLRHAGSELNLMADALKLMREKSSAGEFRPEEMSLEQFRGVLSVTFFDDLRSQTRVASQLPPGLAEKVTVPLYKTFAIYDRLFRLRGVREDYSGYKKPEALEDWENLVRSLSEKLYFAAAHIQQHLEDMGAMEITAED
jgi:hypothetical protein